ncbi:uncharacterized protein FTOL_09560 [Fusarium torulosum]|uniref:Uncharacterized protein n=1 Tax=Fusarium torulosum TaxID=33205 RepID=A0AAE8MFR8_9HYPO|nr:uncharacterized protein FTOL_09560 [Fusarium torulosum]
MIRLYILLCLLPCLLLTTPFTHAALLPRLKASFKLPGVVFTEPVARSLEVVPFKKLPQQPHHGHGLHHTISLVKRLVEDQGDMVEVTEVSLHELLNQINQLKEQVNGMMPSGTSDRQPFGESGASSGGQPGRLPAGSPDESSGSNQPEQLSAPSVQTDVPRLDGPPGLSEVPVITDPSQPSKADAPTTVVKPQVPSASGQLDAPGQLQPEEADRQENTALAAPAATPTRGANNESANLPSEAQPEGLPGDGATSQSEEQNAEETSPAPGGAFVESPDGSIGALSDATSTRQIGSSVPKETQKPSQASDDECVEEDEVSGLPIMRRIPNCTPGSSPPASESAQESLVTLTLVPTPAATGAEKAVPALEIEATSTPTLKTGDSQKLTAPTIISGPPAVAGPEPSDAVQLSVSGSSLSLRTVVFTSAITRSSTIEMTTTHTEFVNANQPTLSLKAPGHVFKEDAESTFNKDGKLAIQESDEEEITQETPRGTPLAMETTPNKTTDRATVTSSWRPTTTISLSRASILTTPEPAQESSPRSPVSFDSGFKTMPRSTASLVERAQE